MTCCFTWNKDAERPVECRSLILVFNFTQACDGNGLSLSFVGKRDINERDVSVSCCSDDLCNYPQMMTTTTKLPITTIANNQG